MDKDVLDFVQKLFQPSVKPWVESYVRGSKPGPLIIEFDPTTACNMACPECISGLLLNQGYVDSVRITALIDEFARVGVRGVIFIGGGEPLAHKSMPAPILQCRERGMAVGLTTNGTLILRHVEVLAHEVAWTRVSVDAARQETFSIFRPSRIHDSFRVVTDGMACLARKKKGLLGYSFLIMERNIPGAPIVTNVPEIFAAARLARELGCDYFELKPAVDMDHHLIPFSSETKLRIQEEVDQMQTLNTDTFRVIAPDSLQLLLQGGKDQPKEYTTCPSLTARAVVTPKGIYPCPYKRGYEDVRLGGIDVPFDEYWHSDERQRRAAAINPQRDCPFFCVRHEFNRTLLALASTYESGVDLLPYMLSTERNDVFI